MNNLLLIFLNQLQDLNDFDIIINDFEKQGYKLFLYEEINSDNFLYTDLPDIIQFYKEQDGEVDKVVVLSNIRDLTYFWYRCYNQIVDDFIYLVEKDEVNYFHASDIYYNAYYNIFEFNRIENETIEGKIYITKKSNLILPLYYDVKYIQLYENFDFERISEKLLINKSYELPNCILDFNTVEANRRETVRIDRIDKRIVFFKGQSSYDVLRVITDYYADFFEKMGFEVDIADLKNGDASVLNDKLIAKNASFIYSTNCIGIDIEVSDGRNLYNALDIPFLGLLGDHPVNHFERIAKSPEKTLFMCLDSENIRYLNKYYPDKHIVTNYAIGLLNKNYLEKSFFEREIDLLFIGTILEPDCFFESLKSYDKSIFTIVNEVSDKILKSNQMLLIDEEIQPYLKCYSFSKHVVAFIHSAIERYIRNYKRYHLVKQLGQSGLTVVCIGEKDKFVKLNVSGNLILRDSVGFQELLDLLNNTKMLINMTGQLYNGVTERIISAMLNGTAVATEADLFTKENFIHKENILTYDFNHMEILIEDIKMYINDLESLADLALNGQRTAKRFDLRKNAAKFPRLAREFDTDLNKEMRE